VPYSFPPDPMREGRMLSGLGVPDLRETNSTFTYVGTDVTDEQVKKPPGGGVMVPLTMEQGVGKFAIEGPSIPGGDGKRMTVNAELTTSTKDSTGVLTIAGTRIELHSQAMSDWFELDFQHQGQKIRGIGRAMLLKVGAQTSLFITPLSMHPREQYSPFTYPRAFGTQLAAEIGLFKTVGWDHDTSALNAEVVDDAVFLEDMNQIEIQRRKMLMERLGQPDWDLLIWVSTATDRVAHMFYRLIDPQHPRYDAALAARHGTAIEDEYKRMDATVAEVLTKLGPDDTLLILSDHGFHGYRRGLHVNQWLRQQGLLALNKDAAGSAREFLFDVDWSKTKAYALGTGQVYLNLVGRERDGIVTDADAPQVLEQIKTGLLALRDKERADAQVVAQVYVGREVFAGGRAADAPDLQIAFAEHYRTSWETILGGVPEALFADNTKKWSGDHAASDVADTDGILISNRPLSVERPAIIDLAPTALSFFAHKAEPQHAGKVLLPAPAP
jgi:predicted AlkP superfamily phosphohydrolase/phosphomutase